MRLTELDSISDRQRPVIVDEHTTRLLGQVLKVIRRRDEGRGSPRNRTQLQR